MRDPAYLRARLRLARRRAPEAACELLEQLLQVEPARRPSAAAALKHRFIVSARPKLRGFDADMLPRMRAFAAASAMKRRGEAHK